WWNISGPLRSISRWIWATAAAVKATREKSSPSTVGSISRTSSAAVGSGSGGAGGCPGCGAGVVEVPVMVVPFRERADERRDHRTVTWATRIDPALRRTGGHRVKPMEHRHLGRSGLKISEIIYGNWLTHASQVEDDRARACVRAALDAGISTFDTADTYANTAA